MRILKLLAAGLAVLVLLAGAAIAAMWAAGYRIQLDGSGTPRVVSRLPAERLAATVEAHRRAQRAAAPDPVARRRTAPRQRRRSLRISNWSGRGPR
jgi:hypothetical protein